MYWWLGLVVQIRLGVVLRTNLDYDRNIKETNEDRQPDWQRNLVAQFTSLPKRTTKSKVQFYFNKNIKDGAKMVIVYNVYKHCL